MTNLKILKMKSVFFAVIFLGGLVASICQAKADTDYQALEEAAPRVKEPAQNPLVAITRVGSRLVAVGVHGLVIWSDDDGHTWQQADVPVDLTLTSVYFKNPRLGWSVGHYGIILQSNDGGKSWYIDQTIINVVKAMKSVQASMAAAMPNSPQELLQLKVANYFARQSPFPPFLTVGPCGNGILAAGYKDMAMFSADNGKTWENWTPEIDNPTFRMIYGQFNNGKNPVLTGESGFVAVSDPACRHFSPVADGTFPTLFGGIGLGNGSFLVYGLAGTAMLTADAGHSWKTINLPTNSLISSGVLDASGEIILGTNNGQLLISHDNGNHFQLSKVSVPFQIASMAVAANNDLIVVGDGGVQVISSQNLK